MQEANEADDSVAKEATALQKSHSGVVRTLLGLPLKALGFGGSSGSDGDSGEQEID